MNKISFVALVAGQQDIYRFIHVTLYSIVKYFDASHIEDFFIITRKNDMKYFQQHLLNQRYNGKIIRLINEDNVFHKKKCVNGYQKQMLLKLYASFLVKTELYITLDSDMYLTKKISLDDILINNKPILNLEYVSQHKEWHEESAKILDIEINDQDMVTGVTPCIMYVTYVRQLLRDYETILLAHKKMFFEYSLYSLYISHKLKIPLIELYYPKNLYDRCCWDHSGVFHLEHYRCIVNDQFSDKETLFSLLQSNMVSRKQLTQHDYNQIIQYIIYQLKHSSTISLEHNA